MTSSRTHIISVSDDKSAILSKEQKFFNSLIKKIAKKKQELLDWQTTITLYQNNYTQNFIPLTETYGGLQESLVYILDEAYHKISLTHAEKNKMKAIICGLSGNLGAEHDNEKLKSIYKKYSGSDLVEEISEENEMMKSLFEDILDIEIGDDVDFNSPDEVMRAIGEKAYEKMKNEERLQNKFQSRRKKTKKILEKEVSAAAEAKEANQISQSIREIYRKLASALHPDRSQDASDQARKEELMQRVNVAYGKKDLLQLLELQLESEQIDQDSINRISENRLKHYNKILKDQLEGIKKEVTDTACVMGMRFNLAPRHRSLLKPQNMLQLLDNDIQNVKIDIAKLEKDISLLKEMGHIKNWLKKQKIRPIMTHDFFL